MAAKALSFDVGDYVVYPKHGVGRVVELQSTEIAGTSLDLYVLRFETEKMTLRVPVERLEEALSAIRKLAGRVEREQQRVEDVTDRFVDLEARLRTLRATEAELQALLAESRQKARKVEEIMAVYRELTEIRSQIEYNKALAALQQATSTTLQENNIKID